MKDRRRRRNWSVERHENLYSSWTFSNFKKHKSTRKRMIYKLKKELKWKDSSLQSSLRCSRFSTNSRRRLRWYLRRRCQDYIFQNFLCYRRQEELRLRADEYHYRISQRLIERRDICNVFEELSRRKICLIVKTSSIWFEAIISRMIWHSQRMINQSKISTYQCESLDLRQQEAKAHRHRICRRFTNHRSQRQQEDRQIEASTRKTIQNERSKLMSSLFEHENHSRQSQ